MQGAKEYSYAWRNVPAARDSFTIKMQAAGKVLSRMPKYEPWSVERASTIIAAHKHREGAVLPIMHALQHVFGCVPEAAIPMIAEALNLSRAEVYGSRTFYHDFRTEPPGRRILKICRANPVRPSAAMPWPRRLRRSSASRGARLRRTPASPSSRSIALASATHPLPPCSTIIPTACSTRTGSTPS